MPWSIRRDRPRPASAATVPTVAISPWEMGSRAAIPGPLFADMPAHALGVPVLYGHEGPTPPLLCGKDPGAVGAPHEVGRRGDDLPLVETGVTAPAPLWGEQVVFPHEPQHPWAAYLETVPHPQPGPYLPVPLALKRRGVQVRPD